MKIGIPVSTSKTQYYINQAYVDYVAEAGYQPVLITPGCDVAIFAGLVDGLIMPGGIDLDPIYYNEDNISSYAVEPEKDAFERELFHAVRELGKPIFGICRGFQLIVREYLLQDTDLEEFLCFTPHVGDHSQTGSLQMGRTTPSHYVDYFVDTLYGLDPTVPYTMPVNSMHHQCLMINFKDPDVTAIRGFQLGAWTVRGVKQDKKNPHAKLCEAFRIRGWNAPILAVQWHPEELRDYELIQNFFDNVQPQPAAAGAV